MRNLKKILALVLALMMVVSVMVVASAADFSGYDDADEIDSDYAEAVEVLTNMGIFRGYDGGFQPKKNVERSQVAALVYRILTADVADKNVGLYENYDYFTDVTAANWFAGYVNFAANGKYVVGVGEDRFDPDGHVTGYQLLVIMLRALGYQNGEFEGTSEWTIRAATYAEELGITDGLKADLSDELTREEVAYILFKAIQANKVEYTPALGYRPTDSSIGWDEFKLERIQGAITANEYADLADSTPLDEGETRLAGKVIDISTTLEDIGESRYAYVMGSTVLSMSDTGLNDVFETGASTVVNDTNTGLDLAGAEKFVNFEGGSTYTASDDRISYIISASAIGVDTAAERTAYEAANGGDFDDDYTTEAGTNIWVYEKHIPGGTALSDNDIANIKMIFDNADLHGDVITLGEVYIGTQSNHDISDRISYNDFLARYVDTRENAVNIAKSDNGEWLKVIDNNGDGDADYIFLTEFAMSYIERISSSGVYTLASLATDDGVSFTTNIKSSNLVTSDQLAVGNVVIYTYIDGKYYVDIADMVTETVDEKGINSQTETITCDGTDYVQSHIGYTNKTYLNDVKQAHTGTTYDLYLDHFGYYRLFIESDYDTFMLLTDGWYEDDNRTETFQAMYWNVEAGNEQQINVANNAFADDVIFTGKALGSDTETWGRLMGADETYVTGDDFATNIVGYSATSDGYALKSVETSAQRIGYDVQAFDVDGLKDPELTASVDNGAIQTTTNTQYYLVIRQRDYNTYNDWTVVDVITWTGYANAPAEAALVEGACAGYAVTHTSPVAGAEYDVADVVVFETAPYADHDTFFVYDVNNFDYAEWVWALGYGEDGAIANDRVWVENENDFRDEDSCIEFYEIYDNGFAAMITHDYADHNIYAGVVDTSWDIEGINYIQVTDIDNHSDLYIIDATVYNVERDNDGDYILDTVSRDSVSVGDEMILFTDDKGNVEYAISVDASEDENGVPYFDVYSLWLNICNDAASLGLVDLDVNTDLLPGVVVSNKTIVAESATGGVITSWKVTFTLVAPEGQKLNEPDLDALLTDKDNGKVTMEQNGNNVDVTVTGLTADNTLVISGSAVVDADVLAAALVEAYNAYVKAPTDATRAAFFAAAVAYEPYDGTDDDADAALDAAEIAAAKIVTDINAAALTSFADIKKAMDLPRLDENSEQLVTWVSAAAEKAYNDKLENIDDAAELYNKAKAVTETYAAWKSATLPSEIAATRAAYLEAFEAISAEELAKTNTFGDAATETFGTECKWMDAYNDRYNEIGNTNTELVNKAKTALDGATWTAIVGTDLTDKDVQDAIMEQVEAVLAAADVTGVDVSFHASYTPEAPAVGTTDPDVWFQIELKAGAATDAVTGQTVSVTNNWSATSLTAAIEDDLEGIASFKATDTKSDIEGRLEKYVSNHYPLTAVNAEVEIPDGVHAGDKITATVTGTHVDLGTITVVAEIVVQAN